MQTVFEELISFFFQNERVLRPLKACQTSSGIAESSTQYEWLFSWMWWCDSRCSNDKGFPEGHSDGVLTRVNSFFFSPSIAPKEQYSSVIIDILLIAFSSLIFEKVFFNERDGRDEVVPE